MTARFLFIAAGRWGRILTLVEAFLILGVYVASLSISSAVLYSETISEPFTWSMEIALVVRALLFVAILMLSMMSVGLYNARLRESLVGVLNRCIFSFAICTVLLAFLSVFGGVLAVFWLPPVVTILSAMAAVFLFRCAVHLFVGDAFFKSRVLVIGAGERAAIIERRMRRQSDRINFELLGYYPMEGDSSGQIGDDKIVRDLEMEKLESWLLDNRVDEIVIACDERRCQLPVSSLFQARLLGVDVTDILDFIERETGQVAVNMMYPSWMIYASGFTGKDSLYSFFGRFLNILLAIMILVITLPVMLVTALLIYFEDRGPVFFVQSRVGFRGKVFHILKFRSMRVDAEKDGAKWATKNDSRTTRIGHFIRLYRIDELPQLFNVIKGDMGFVGPRPERPEFVDRLALSIPYYNERHNVKPGLTGWAQLRYPYGASEEDALEKLKYDLYYIKNRSILLDLLIFLQTVEVVLFAKGSR